MPPTPSPTYERLRDTIAKRMRMSHVVQPLMLMELLGRRSPAPAQDVARRFLGEDMTQIEYYTERVKRMVGKVLTGNGVTRYERGTYDLVGGEELSDAERDQLLELSRQRLDAFRMQRGEEMFAHRSRHRTPISGSIKVRVLTRAKGRCECCGVGCCLANPASKGTGGGPHPAQEPWRLGRPQQPAGALLPLQGGQARSCWPSQGGWTDCRGMQASYRLRRKDGGSGYWRSAAG
jgi:hypothetical protein